MAHARYCWINKATHAQAHALAHTPTTCIHTRSHTQKFVIFTTFPQQQWFRERTSVLRYTYKVVKIWPGQTVTCLHTNSPGHIWTTLYMRCFADFEIFVVLFCDSNALAFVTTQLPYIYIWASRLSDICLHFSLTHNVYKLVDGKQVLTWLCAVVFDWMY
jgi:hypothetical protein